MINPTEVNDRVVGSTLARGADDPVKLTSPSFAKWQHWLN